MKKNLDNHGDALQDNYRPPQAVNGRTVYHFSRDDAAGRQYFFSMHIWQCGRNFLLILDTISLKRLIAYLLHFFQRQLQRLFNSVWEMRVTPLMSPTPALQAPYAKMSLGLNIMVLMVNIPTLLMPLLVTD